VIRLKGDGKSLAEIGVTEKTAQAKATILENISAIQLKGRQGRFLADCVKASSDCHVYWLESVLGGIYEANKSRDRWRCSAQQAQVQVNDWTFVPKKSVETEGREWPGWNEVFRYGYRLHLERLKRLEDWKVRGIYPA
jgi:hypothetical protein